MSDLLAAAAAALGTPEALVKRAADARAAATGVSVDEILAAWSGGGSVPAPAAPTAPVEDTATSEAATSDAAAESAPAPATSTPPAPAASPGGPPPEAAPVLAPTGPYKPPVLVGAVDNPLAVLAGVVGLFLIVLLVGLIGPSISTEIPGVRSSEVNFTDEALRGQSIYTSMGCAACHTQMVRPVVADVGLGLVSLNDTNQILGTRRFGPDLADMTDRRTGAEIADVIAGGVGHPGHNLSSSDMAALVAYLLKAEDS